MAEERTDAEPEGVYCPTCGCQDIRTTHTEPISRGRIRRRKECRHCGRKFVTVELMPGHAKAHRQGRQGE